MKDGRVFFCECFLVLVLLATVRIANSGAASNNGAIEPIAVVDVRDLHIQESVPTLLAIQTCAGLFNRNVSVAGAAYTIWDDRDEIWLREIHGNNDTNVSLNEANVESFLTHCISTVARGRYIHYNYSSQQLMVPYLVTLAAVLDAVPLVQGLQESLLHFQEQLSHSKAAIQRNSSLSFPFQKIFDAEETFAGFSAYDATKYLFDHHVQQTKGLSIMNPGYNWTQGYISPPLTTNPHLQWADYVIKERLFNFYLKKACLPFNREHRLLEDLTQGHHPNTTHFPQPIAVVGYNDVKFGFPAYLFEAETLCVSKHNLGQIPTQTTNLAFWSRKPPITQPLLQSPAMRNESQSPQTCENIHNNHTFSFQTNACYNASKTYIAFVIGDGDNIKYLKKRNYDWVQKRLTYCTNPQIPPKQRCFPLSWTLSPHAFELTPDLLQWYVRQASKTGQDYFLLPPSGYLYSYPSMMDHSNQKRFVTKTEEAARLLNTTGTVDWEFAFSWGNAYETFFPRYAGSNQQVRGIFSVNVPYNVPVQLFGRNEFYKLVYSRGDDGTIASGNPVVLFRPREWRGTSGHSVRVPLTWRENLKVLQMAEEINGYPKGTVTHLYITSDDHADLDSVYSLVPLLSEHVEVVHHEALIDLALQRSLVMEEQEQRQRDQNRHWSFLSDTLRLLWG